jgi:hypothetical protein
MDGECALQQHSAFLVCYPPFCRFLAQDEPFTVSSTTTDLGGDHLCSRLGYMAVAFSASLFFSVDVGAGSAFDVLWLQDVRRHTL